MKIEKHAAALVAAALVSACFSDDASNPSPAAPAATAADADSTVAQEWLDLLYQVVRTEALSPPAASRAFAYSGVAFYEAVVDGIPGKRSLGGQLNGLAALPAPPAGEIDWELAGNAALASLLPQFFATAMASNLMDIADLADQLETAASAGVPQEVVDRSLQWGDTVGDAIFAWSQTDGFTMFNNCAYVPPVGAGLWEPTPPGFANALQPCWGQMRTFALVDGTDCAPLGPPPFSTSTTSPFYSEALEVYVTVENLTAEQLAIAQFWADNPGATGTPAGHWIAILSQVAEQRDLTLDVTAEAFAKIGIGMADAFISCWNTKYLVNLIRPVSYIQDEIDAMFTSAVGTPPFPEYTSGHSTQSGAASVLLHDLLGEFTFVDNTHAGTFPSRSFDTFLEAADEAAISRLYGGIHYRAAIEDGVEQGRCVAETLLAAVDFEE